MLKFKKLDQTGILNPLVIPLIVAGIVLVIASVMAVVYYGKFVDQRDNNQPVIDSAVKDAQDAEKTKLEADFAAREKLPNKVYISPSALGTVNITYPKTWSSYVINTTGTDMEFYAHPNYVPSANTNYALRMSVVNQPFSSQIKTYDPQVKRGDLKASSVQISGVQGSRLDGFLKPSQEGSMVLFPLRDKTLKVWTENTDFRGDFDNIVLKNLTFVP